LLSRHYVHVFPRAFGYHQRVKLLDCFNTKM